MTSIIVATLALVLVIFIGIARYVAATDDKPDEWDNMND